MLGELRSFPQFAMLSLILFSQKLFLDSSEHTAAGKMFHGHRYVMYLSTGSGKKLAQYVMPEILVHGATEASGAHDGTFPIRDVSWVKIQ